MSDSLDDFLAHNPMVWRGNAMAKQASVATGYASLDEALPAAGWPQGAVVELLLDRWGVGELQLCLPALLSLVQSGQRVVFVAPPYPIYLPAFVAFNLDLFSVMQCEAKNEALWVMEQLLASGACAAVLAWPAWVKEKDIRRLQLAADKSQSLAFLLFRGPRPASMAALRLKLSAVAAGLALQIVKVRGGRAGRCVTVALD